MIREPKRLFLSSCLTLLLAGFAFVLSFNLTQYVSKEEQHWTNCSVEAWRQIVIHRSWAPLPFIVVLTAAAFFASYTLWRGPSPRTQWEKAARRALLATLVVIIAGALGTGFGINNLLNVPTPVFNACN